MRQIVFIHGGETFASYEEYLAALKSWTFDPTRGEQKRWKDSLKEKLGAEWEFLAPAMPNKQNAKYEEWKIWFDKVAPYLKDGVILIGHSLGGIFLAKYLSENKLLVRPKAVFILAAPFDDVEFKLGALDLSQAEKVFLYHSKEDPVVPFGELAKYQAQLPEAAVRVFEDRRHFLQEEFPEILADIAALGAN